MFSKIKAMFKSGVKEDSNKEFCADLLTDEQRKELDAQVILDREARLDEDENKKLSQALSWAISANLNEIEDPDEKHMIEQIQDDEKKRLKEGVKAHVYFNSHTFGSEITPDILTGNDRLNFFGKKVYGVKMPKEKPEIKTLGEALFCFKHKLHKNKTEEGK